MYALSPQNHSLKQ